MITSLFILASVGFIFGALYDAYVVLSILHKYQGKAVSLPHFLSRTKGKQLPFSKSALSKWILMAIYPMVIFHEHYFLFYYLAITYVFTYDLIVALGKCTHVRIRHDRSMIFPIILFSLAVITMTLVYLVSPLDRFLWLLVISKLLLPIILMWNIILSLLEEFYWDFKASKLSPTSLTQDILIMGNTEAGIVGTYLKVVLHDTTTPVMYLQNPQKKDLVTMKSQSTYYLYMTEPKNKEELELILSFINPLAIIVTGMPRFMTHTSLSEKKEIASLLEGSLTKNGMLYATQESQIGKYITRKKRFSKVHLTEDVFLKKEKTKIHFPEKKGYCEIPVVTERARYISLTYPLLRMLGFTNHQLQQRVKHMETTGSFLQLLERSCVSHLNYCAETDLREVVTIGTYMKLFHHKKIIIIDTSGDRDYTRSEMQNICQKLAKVFDYFFILPGKRAKMYKKMIQESPQVTYTRVASATQITSLLQPLLSPQDIVVYVGLESEELYQMFTRKPGPFVE